MFTTLLAAAALILPALAQDSSSSSACQGYQIDTPATLNQCSNTQITWSGGNPDFWLLVLNSSDPCGDAVIDYGTHSSWSMTAYNVPLVKGQQVELYLGSSNGCESYSQPITVGDGPTSCLSAAQLAEYNAGNKGSSNAGANNAEGAPSSTGSAKPSSTPSKNQPLSGAVSNGENAATTATYSLPVLALSAAAGLFALL